MRFKMLKIGLILVMFTSVTFRCAKEKAYSQKFKATKCVILLVDGPRWTETWGDATHTYQPNLFSTLKNEGCVFTNFYNNGNTFTLPGHTATLTGKYQDIVNDGTQLPDNPGLSQLFLEKYPTKKAAIITSKDKLEVLGNCIDANYNGKYKCYTDCGVAGLTTGYRLDSVTIAHVKLYLTTDHPDFLFVQLKEPDAAGHANDWTGYLNGIIQGDAFALELWNQLQADPFYKDQTTFIVTNDHGRHLDGTADGFISHGDGCEGCRHINLFMAGPDIKKNTIISVAYEQTDINKTVTTMLNLNQNYGNGKIIKSAFGK